MKTLFFNLNINPSKEKFLLTSVLESITDGFFFVDNDWNVLYWNKAAERIMTLDNDLIAGKNLWDVFADAKEMEFYKLYHKSKKDNISIEFDIYYPPNELWLEIKTYPFEEGLAVYFKDVTFKRKVALEIENTKKQHEAIINATSDAIWSVNPEFKLLTANKTYRDKVLIATGLHIGSGNSVFNGYPEDVVKRRKAYYERGLAGEYLIVEEKITSESDSRVIFFEISYSPILDVNGMVTGVACFGRDITERKQYQFIIEETNSILAEKEQELQEVMTDLQTVLNSSLDLICTTDTNGNFVHVNDAFKHLLGYDTKELKGRLYTELLHSEDVSKTIEISGKILEGARVTTFRNRMIRKTGKELHIMWSSHFDPIKQITFSVGRDASTLVQAELLKEHSERRFSTLIEKGKDMVSLIDKDANVLFTSPNIKNILGFEADELINRSAFHLIHPDDIAFAAEKLAAIFTQKEIESVTIRCKNASGEWRWVELVGTNLLDDPAIEGIVINSRDITDRKLQEEELKTTNERFQTVLNVTNEVIWEWDLVTDKVFKNANHEMMFGYKEQDNGTGKSWLSKIHNDDVTRVKASILKTIETGDTNPWQQEYKYYRENGELAYVMDRGVLIKDNAGKPIRMVGSMQDISERKRSENVRELIIEELTRSIEDLRQFSYITSHNLRAPLSNMIGILSIIDYPDLNDTNKKMLELLQASTLQLKETIQDLTDIMVVRNKSNGEIEKVNIEKTFIEVKEVYLNTLQHIPFNLVTDFKLKEVTLNKAYISSIFMNLVSNAVKYRSKDRVLKIKLTATQEVDGICTIKFSDNGIGLDTHRLENRLFGMYQRFHDTAEGKGLGLFIVKSQVTAMGGTIKMESELDKGTTFIVTLPLKKIF